MKIIADGPQRRDTRLFGRPVWAFAPEMKAEDVLVRSGVLWGTDILFEGLPVSDDDNRGRYR